jgi:hypothetical protein
MFSPFSGRHRRNFKGLSEFGGQNMPTTVEAELDEDEECEADRETDRQTYDAVPLVLDEGRQLSRISAGT